MEIKKAWQSKTLGINIIAVLGVILSNQFGIDLSEAESTGILAIINIMLRIITKQPLG